MYKYIMWRLDMIVAFCGHSDYISSSEDEKKVLEILESRVGGLPCEIFLGEYGFFDSFAFRCAKRYKQTHPAVKLVFITPYLLETNTEVRKKELEKFDYILYPQLEKIPPRYAIIHRNRWIVEQADILISYISHSFGGAYKMFQYAKKRNIEIYNIAPWDVE